MSDGFVERRRAPRVTVAVDGPSVSLPTTVSVQVLDISEHGALLASPVRVEPGQVAQLRTRIAVEPLSAHVEVRRVTNGLRQAGTYRLGVQFTSIDDDSRRKIERLVKADA